MDYVALVLAPLFWTLIYVRVRSSGTAGQYGRYWFTVTGAGAATAASGALVRIILPENDGGVIWWIASLSLIVGYFTFALPLIRRRAVAGTGRGDTHGSAAACADDSDGMRAVPIRLRITWFICCALAPWLLAPLLGGIAVYLGSRARYYEERAGTLLMILGGVATIIGTVFQTYFILS